RVTVNSGWCHRLRIGYEREAFRGCEKAYV
ncbi:MAG: hypothetical protein ACJAUZ_002709, partial [Flavobacteriaceae bacterium]